MNGLKSNSCRTALNCCTASASISEYDTTHKKLRNKVGFEDNLYKLKMLANQITCSVFDIFFTRHSLTREITSLRERASQLDAELELTKRHLTNERYER